ncbi:pilin [Microbulbifer sp. YPW16]|nr:pilin [Microbulbifer sp. YPW16]
MGGLKSTVTEIYSTEGSFDDADSGSLGIPAAADVTGDNVQGVTVTNGVITAQMASSNVAEAIQDATISMSPVTSSGSIDWVCVPGLTGTALDNKYLPSECRT